MYLLKEIWAEIPPLEHLQTTQENQQIVRSLVSYSKIIHTQPKTILGAVVKNQLDSKQYEDQTLIKWIKYACCDYLLSTIY